MGTLYQEQMESFQLSRTDGIIPVSRTDEIIPVSRTDEIIPVSRTDGIIPVSRTDGIIPVSRTDGIIPFIKNRWNHSSYPEQIESFQLSRTDGIIPVIKNRWNHSSIKNRWNHSSIKTRTVFLYGWAVSLSLIHVVVLPFTLKTSPEPGDKLQMGYTRALCGQMIQWGSEGRCTSFYLIWSLKLKKKDCSCKVWSCL